MTFIINKISSVGACIFTQTFIKHLFTKTRTRDSGVRAEKDHAKD